MIEKILIWLLSKWVSRDSQRTFGAARSPKWESVRKQHIQNHPTCEVCGKTGTRLSPVNVHHCIPFHIDKSLELTETNLITLCPDHHLFVGHLMNFSSFNKDVRIDSEVWNSKIKNRPQ